MDVKNSPSESIEMLSATAFYIVVFVYFFWIFPKKIAKAKNGDVSIERKWNAYHTFRQSFSLKVLFALSIIFFIYGAYNLLRLYIRNFG